MGLVKFYRSTGFDQPRTPISSGLSFSKLIAGKTIDEMGWYGDEHNISEAHIRFNDDSYLLIGWSPEFECPAATYVPPSKK